MSGKSTEWRLKNNWRPSQYVRYDLIVFLSVCVHANIDCVTWFASVRHDCYSIRYDLLLWDIIWFLWDTIWVSVRHDLFLCETWFVFLWDMIWVLWDMICFSVRHDLYITCFVRFDCFNTNELWISLIIDFNYFCRMERKEEEREKRREMKKTMKRRSHQK